MDNIPGEGEKREDEAWEKAVFLFVWFNDIDREGEPDEVATSTFMGKRVDERKGVSEAAEYMWEMRGHGSETMQNLYEDYQANCGESRQDAPVQTISKEDFRLKMNAERARTKNA